MNVLHRLTVSVASASWLLVITGCATSVPELSKAIVEPETIQTAIKVAKELDDRAETPPPTGESWFRIVKGRIPVIVTAPHATPPFREGRFRFSDGGGTAALAQSLAELAGVWVVHTTYASPSDPNYYDDNEFKRTLKGLIDEVQPVLILDIHGSSPMRPYDVDFGTMNGQSLLGRRDLLAQLIDQLGAEGIDNFSLNRFAASQNATITKFSSNLGVPSIQLEINAMFLMPQGEIAQQQAHARITQGLVRYLHKVAENACKRRDCQSK